MIVGRKAAEYHKLHTAESSLGVILTQDWDAALRIPTNSTGTARAQNIVSNAEICSQLRRAHRVILWRVTTELL